MTLDDNLVLKTAHDFWCSLRQTIGLPDIRQLDVTAIPRSVLPHLIVAEITRGDFDLSRLRLAGSEVSRWFRELPDGMDAAAYGSLTDPAYMQHMRDLLAELIRHRRPVWCRSTYTLDGLTTGDPPNTVTAEQPGPAHVPWHRGPWHQSGGRRCCRLRHPGRDPDGQRFSRRAAAHPATGARHRGAARPVQAAGLTRKSI